MKSYEIIQKLMEKEGKKPRDLHEYIGMSLNNFYNTIHPEKRTYKRKDGKGSDIKLELLCACLNILGYKLLVVPKYRVPDKDEIELEPSYLIDTSTRAEKKDARKGDGSTSRANVAKARKVREEKMLAKGKVMNHNPKSKKVVPIKDNGEEMELSEEALWRMKIKDFD